MERVGASLVSDAAKHVADNVSRAANLQTSDQYTHEPSAEQKLLERIAKAVEKQAAGKTGADPVDHAETVRGREWRYPLRMCEGVYIYTIIPEGFDGLRIKADTTVGRTTITLVNGWNKIFLPINSTLRGDEDLTGSFPTIMFTGDLIIRYSDKSPL